MPKQKLIRITTVPISLKLLLKGQLRFMNQYFDVIGIASNEKELYEVEKDEQISIVSVEMTRTISPIKDLKSVWRLYKILKKEKPFIVHTHTPKAGTVGMLAAKLASVPNRLHTIAGLPLLEATGIKRKILNLVEKITYLCATKIYPNSKGLYDIILKQKFTKENKLKVIANGSSNGIDTDYFNPSLFSVEEKKYLQIELQINPNDIVFVFVGRLVGDKGINELVEAFQQLNTQKNNVKLLLVGSFEKELDPLKKETQKIIQSNNNIISVGFQKDVRPYFSISHCLVFPTYREGFPNVVMQAGAMGLPSIVSDINGCNEIIKEGENGVIIPVKNTQELYLKMLFLLDNHSIRNKMANQSRNMIVDRYNQNVVWEAILEEYKMLKKNV